MKASRLIHYLLVLALCLGQMAAHAHMIEHLHFAADQAAHLSKHLDQHSPGEHFGQHDHNHNHTRLNDSSPTKIDVDCAAYHAFAGLAGIKPTACIVFAVQLSSITIPTPYPATVYISSAAIQSIRAPPTTPETRST